MMLYVFYNADLINIAKGKFELSTGFVDDCAFIAVANSLDEAHLVLKNMMECTGGSLEWSLSHNSPFKLSKLAIMDFTRTSHDTASTPLQIDKPGPNNTTTSHTITSVSSYKYLGVIFNPKLSWNSHITKVAAKAAWWSHQLWRIAKTARGLSPNQTHWLYI